VAKVHDLKNGKFQSRSSLRKEYRECGSIGATASMCAVTDEDGTLSVFTVGDDGDCGVGLPFKDAAKPRRIKTQPRGVSFRRLSALISCSGSLGERTPSPLQSNGGVSGRGRRGAKGGNMKTLRFVVVLWSAVAGCSTQEEVARTAEALSAGEQPIVFSDNGFNGDIFRI